MSLRVSTALALLLPALAGCGASASREPTLPLMERLAREAAARPEGTPRTEQVLQALQGAGLVLGEQRQYLGATTGARYCYAARTLRGVQLSVCEFGDAASATTGRARVLGERPPPGRTVLLNRTTTLLVQPPAGSPGAAVEARVAAAAFEKL
jgi:hypothetical protein